GRPERSLLMQRGRAGRPHTSEADHQRRAAGTGGGRRCERGSISVELVVLAPGLALLLLLIAAGARVVEGQGHIDGAARDGGGAARAARSYPDAVPAAQSAGRGRPGPPSPGGPPAPPAPA